MSGAHSQSGGQGVVKAPAPAGGASAIHSVLKLRAEERPLVGARQ